MRTKHLLTAIMLPALFAACTNDEFESISQNAETVSGRKLVDNVTLSFSMNDGADTRLAYGSNGYTWQANDTIGACLMDVIDLTEEEQADGTKLKNYYNPKKTWSERFNLTDYIQTNYKFTRNAAGAWKTEAKLCEGNYFFCYPYNANMGVRDAYTFSVKSQTMSNTTAAALQEAYAKNNAFMGFSKVEASNAQSESLGIDMVSVFGATGFTLKNTGTNTYKIEKIVLRGDKVVNTATVNPIDCDDDIQKNTKVDKKSRENFAATSKEFNVANYVDYEYDVQYNRWANDNYNKTNALRDVLNYGDKSSVEVTLAGGNMIATQKSINVIAMVAARGDLTAESEDAVLDIYTDKGMIRDIKLTHHYTSNPTNGVATTNVLTDKALKTIGSGEKVEITFDDTSIDVPAELAVTSDADLAALIHWNAKKDVDIKAKLANNVTITKAMYDELAGSKITGATIEADGNNNVVTLAADVPAGALDKFTYRKGTASEVKVVVKGTQTLAANHEDASVEIDGGAVLNVNKKASIKSVKNYGTLNVNADLTAETENMGAISVAAKKTMSQLENHGTVTNRGIITTLENAAREGYDADPAAVTNEGTIKGGSNAGTITNNEGEVVLSANEGTVYANNKSATRVIGNNTGSIVITNLEDDGNYKVEGEKGAIVQQLASASTKDVDTRANTVWLTGTLSVEPLKNKDGVLQTIDLGTVTVYAKSSEARINGNDKKQTLILKSITVGESSTLVINNTRFTFKVAGTKVKMEGKAKKVATLIVNSNVDYGTNVSLEAEVDDPNNESFNIIKDYSAK